MTIEIDRHHPIHDVLAGIVDLSRRDDVYLRDVVAAFGTASFVPALIVPALLVISPLSGIPLFSSAMGLTIALIAAQMLFGRDHLWLPGFLMRRRLGGARLRRAVPKLAPFGDWIDRRTAPRLRVLTAGPLRVLPRTGILLSGAAMPFLEIVPFSSSVLGLSVVLSATGLLARDGAFVIAGAVVQALALAIPFFVVGRILG